MPQRPVPTLEHFKLLQSFGKNKLQREHPDRREQLWKILCESIHLSYIPHPDVVEAWMAYVAGESTQTNLAINGNIHPSRVVVGVLYQGRMAASHTTKTVPLLKKIAGIYRECFKNDNEFLEAMQQMCFDVLEARKKAT
jgi:hypothetical protein